MEQAVHAKMDKMGGSHYVITSARMGNRTAGTAIIFK
ncbi:YdgH/BhsA/McbA-like domain containing protein [uncultured Pluralibacter sp.]